MSESTRICGRNQLQARYENLLMSSTKYLQLCLKEVAFTRNDFFLPPRKQESGHDEKNMGDNLSKPITNNGQNRPVSPRQTQIVLALDKHMASDDQSINCSKPVNTVKSLKESVSTDIPNPFSSFAYGGFDSGHSTVMPLATASNKSISKYKFVAKNPSKKKHRKLSSSKSFKVDTKMDSSKDWEVERERLRSKWMSFAETAASIEQRRFQVFVAVRLSAQAQETVIRSAMKNLHTAFAIDGEIEFSGEGLSVNAVANIDPKHLAKLIPSVHYANSKSRQIVTAAREIKLRFQGIVPETKNELLQLTGIGPKLADVLCCCNTNVVHSSYIKTQK